MATEKTSQTHNAAPEAPRMFDPFGFAKLMDAQIKQVESAHDALAKMHEDGFAQARASVEAAASMMVDGMSYGHRLQQEWRKLALDAWRQGATAATSARA
jgi:hypothetical protein